MTFLKLYLVINMSEVHMKQRVRAMVSSPRKVTSNRLGGFAVESERPVQYKATGNLKQFLDDKGMLVK